MSFGPVCDVSSTETILASPPAIGTDGTEYVVTTVRSAGGPETAPRTFCDASRRVLEAHLPRNPATPDDLGSIRWSVALPTPAGLGTGGQCRQENAKCDFVTFVTPRSDGSIQVETTTFVFAGGVDGDSVDRTITVAFTPTGASARQLALFSCCPAPDLEDVDGETIGNVKSWVDASGHPGFHRPEDTQISAFSLVDVTSAVDADAVAALDPCAITSFCGALPAGHTAQWLFGDGTMSDKVGQLETIEHQYPHSAATDEFLGLVLHYDENGLLVEKAYFRLRT
jgi:hypothetical protein